MLDDMETSSFPSQLKRDMFSNIVTVSSRQVAPTFSEQFIHTGYRLPHQPWSYYWKSLFQLHNETANVWLHIVATVHLLAKMWDYFRTYDMVNDKYAWGIIGSTLGNLLGAVLSSIAHQFHSKSIWWHYVLFMMDYAGITLYTFGSGLGCIYICSHKDMYVLMEPFFIPLNLFLSVLIFNVCCRAKLKSSTHGRRRVVLVCSVLLHAVFIIIPVMPRYLDCISQKDCAMESMSHITLTFALVLLGMLIFVSHLPERAVQGVFDYVGHSHSLFHFVGLCIVYTQLDGMEVDISKGVADHTEPSIVKIMAAYVVLLSAQVLTLFHLRGDLDERVEKDTIRWEEAQSKDSE